MRIRLTGRRTPAGTPLFFLLLAQACVTTAPQPSGGNEPTGGHASSAGAGASAGVAGEATEAGSRGGGAGANGKLAGGAGGGAGSPGTSPPDDYEDPLATYPGLDALTEPAVGGEAVHVDTRLRLTFDEPPALGTDGSVRIFKAEDDSLVDVIPIQGATDSLGPEVGTNAGRVRSVRIAPFEIRQNALVVSPHQGALEYGTEYYIGVSADALTGTLDGVEFAGIGKAAGWHFTTRTSGPEGADVTVDDDGDAADFRTVQGALSYVMATIEADTPARVTIADGDYRELLFLRSKNNLTLRGESREGVVIRYENYEAFNAGTGSSTPTTSSALGGGRALFLVENADLLTLDNLTLHNTHRRTGTGDQAETLYFNSTSRLIATDASFYSEQDTLQLKGYSWFYRCLVAGSMDFIWGAARAALFEDSEIRMLGDSRNTAPSGGYLVQSRTTLGDDRGFVFLDSRITHGPGATGNTVAIDEDAATYLARSGGSTTYFDNVAYINCGMDTHIATVGWADSTATTQPDPNPPLPSAESGWKEYGTTDLEGSPCDLAGRSAFAHVMTADEVAAGYASRDLIFAAYGTEGWNPEP